MIDDAVLRWVRLILMLVGSLVVGSRNLNERESSQLAGIDRASADPHRTTGPDDLPIPN